MAEMATEEPMESDISEKSGKRDSSEIEGGAANDKDLEHVLKKRKISGEGDDLVSREIAQAQNDGVVSGGFDVESKGAHIDLDTFVVTDGDAPSCTSVPSSVIVKQSLIRNELITDEMGGVDSQKGQGVSVIVLNVSSEDKSRGQTSSDVKENTAGIGQAVADQEGQVDINVSYNNAEIAVALIPSSSGANKETLQATDGGGNSTVCATPDAAQGDGDNVRLNTIVTDPLKETPKLDGDINDQEVFTNTVSPEANAKISLNGDAVVHDIGSDCPPFAKDRDFTIQGDVPSDGVGRFVNSEKGVGITEFVNPSGSLHGIIKQRYSDFIVNELNLAGQIVELTTKEIPKEAACECPDVSAFVADDVTQLLDGLQNDRDAEKVLIPVDNLNKDERRKIHQFVRAKYSRLLSTTEDVESKKYIVVSHGAKDQSRQGKNRKQTSWPPDRGNYTQFVLYKENIDTMDAINIISKYVKMNPASFTYSGTKDKRAITSQLVTVYRVTAEKLAGLNRVLRNMTLGNFEYVKSPLRLGDLTGNHFKIVLRKIDGDAECVNACMKSLAENGFINYFGMQRFGTTAIPTYHIGRALLRGDWKDAIELILKPRDADDANLAECRKLWWETRDASTAMTKLHRKNTVEGQLLYGLSSHGPNDLVNAINCVPRNVRLMYTHSYQSYVWNHIVSRRLQKYQFDVIDGDLVDASPAAEVGMQSVEKLTPRIYKASESAEVPDITAVVLPLPGYDVMYPDNEIAVWYREAMIADGLDIDNMKHKVQNYSLSGSYRRMLVKPTDVSWAVVKYDDVTVPLLSSDLDKLSGNKPLTDDQDGAHTALKMEFSLPPSSYATMALREVMKIDTSVAFQSTLK